MRALFQQLKKNPEEEDIHNELTWDHLHGWVRSVELCLTSGSRSCKVQIHVRCTDPMVPNKIFS